MDETGHRGAAAAGEGAGGRAAAAVEVRGGTDTPSLYSGPHSCTGTTGVSLVTKISALAQLSIVRSTCLLTDLASGGVSLNKSLGFRVRVCSFKILEI